MVLFIMLWLAISEILVFKVKEFCYISTDSASFLIFQSAKYPNFGQRLPIQTTHHTFLEGRHPDVTKNPYYILFPKGRQKKVSNDEI